MLCLRPRTNAVTSWVMPIDGPPINSHARSIPQSRHWSGRYAAYRSSKTALNAVTVFYARTLAGDAIKVNALAPGLRRTDLNATAAASEGDPAEAATAAVRLALLPADGPTGKFFSWDGTPVPW